jgi:site-specific recombinase XerC
MDVLIERACGLDVHKKSITACIVTPEGKEIKTFRIHTVYLLELIDWIKEHRCTHVAMGECIIRNEKGEKQRTVLMNSKIINALRDYLKDRSRYSAAETSKFLFVSKKN